MCATATAWRPCLTCAPLLGVSDASYANFLNSFFHVIGGAARGLWRCWQALTQQCNKCKSATVCTRGHQWGPGRECEAPARPQGTPPEDVSLEAALELLRERAKRPPSARSRRTRTGPPKQAPADAAGEAAGRRVAGAASLAPRARKRGKASGQGEGGSAGGARAGAEAPAAAGAEREARAAAGRGTRAGGAATKGAARSAAKKAAAKPAKPARGRASRAADAGAGAGAGKRPLSAYLRFCADARPRLRAEAPGLRPPEVRAAARPP